MREPIDTSSHQPRQRSARTDPAMRDGDSAHGSPYEHAGDEVELDSDTDVGDGPAAELNDAVADAKGAAHTRRVDPDALDTLADDHAGPSEEAEYYEENAGDGGD